MRTVNQIAIGGIKYGLIEEEMVVGTDMTGWGISIETDIFGFFERASFASISTSRAYVENLMHRLIDGFVTPYSADEVIDNYLVEFES